MNKKEVLQVVWAAIIFIALVIGVDNAVAADSNSVWFLILVTIAHMGKTVFERGRDGNKQ